MANPENTYRFYPFQGGLRFQRENPMWELEATARRRVKEQEARRLIAELDRLDFSDYGTVLGWVDRFQTTLSCYVGGSFYANQAAVVFREHGFESGANAIKGAKARSVEMMGGAEGYARYLVGQALAMDFGEGAITPFHRGVLTWKEHFGEEGDNKRAEIA